MSEQEPEITVQKIAFITQVSAESLGFITEEEARKRYESTPLLRRMRWALEDWWVEHKPHLHFGPCE